MVNKKAVGMKIPMLMMVMVMVVTSKMKKMLIPMLMLMLRILAMITSAMKCFYAATVQKRRL